MKLQVKRERFVGLSYLGLGCFMLGVAVTFAIITRSDVSKGVMDTIVVGYCWRGGGAFALPGKYGGAGLTSLLGIVCVWVGIRVLRRRD